jgi:hypothetical protein
VEKYYCEIKGRPQMNPRDIVSWSNGSSIRFDASKLGALMMAMEAAGEEIVLYDQRPQALKLEVIDNMLDLG